MKKILHELKKDMAKARRLSNIAYSLLFIAFLGMAFIIKQGYEDKISILALFFSLTSIAVISLAVMLYSYELKDRICKGSLKKILTYPIDNEASKNNFARLQRSLAASKDTESCISEWLDIESAEEKVTVKQEVINRKL